MKPVLLEQITRSRRDVYRYIKECMNEAFYLANYEDSPFVSTVMEKIFNIGKFVDKPYVSLFETISEQLKSIPNPKYCVGFPDQASYSSLNVCTYELIKLFSLDSRTAFTYNFSSSTVSFDLNGALRVTANFINGDCSIKLINKTAYLPVSLIQDFILKLPEAVILAKTVLTISFKVKL